MGTSTTWTIGRKLMLSFLLVSAITALSGGVGYYAVSTGAKSIDDLGAVRLPSVDSLLTIKEGQQNIRGTLRTLGIAGLPPVIRARQYDNLAKTTAQYENAWKVYELLPQTPEEGDLWKQFVPAWKEWTEDRNRAVDLCRQFDALGLQDPVALGKSLELFRGDHFRASEQVLHMLHTKKMYEGGEDHALCNCGKWLPTFKTDNPDMAKTVQAIATPHQRFHAAVKKIKQLVREGQVEAAYAEYDKEMDGAAEEVFAHFRTMCQTADQAIALLNQTQELLLGRLTDRQRAAEGLLNKIVQLNRDAASAQAQISRGRAAVFKTVSLSAAVVGVLAAMALGFLVTRGINYNLARISTQLNEGADQVSDAASQISSTSQSLAQGAGEQASSLEETSSALEEMAAMTRTNTSNAKEASGLADQARQAAGEGDKSMVQLNDAMTGINQSSEKISKIVKVIEEISFQTNLLALNASVEAARAGEHGKGFAVVADEVRNLAQRAAQAARETTGLIDGAVDSARQGTQVAAEVGKSFGAIVSSAARLSELFSGISKASEEQAQGVDQVNIAVSQIDKVTQANAAGAEQSASASEELAAQAQALKGMVGELVAMVGGGTRPPQDRSAAGKAAMHTDGLGLHDARRARAGVRAESRPRPPS